MTTPNPAPSARLRPAAPGSAWLYVLVLVAAGAGVLVGVRWQASIAPMLGMKPAAAPGVDDAPAGGAKQLWTCGMHPQVIQDKPGDCPICHMKLTPLNVDNGGKPGASGSGGSTPAQGAQGVSRKVKYWWDPMMSPPYISDRPGKSPMGMDLVPVYEGETSAAAGGAQVVIDPAVVQNMGVRVALVSEGPLKKAVRLVGYLDEAQPNIFELNLRVSGWIRRLYANTEGQRVEAGDPLFDLYSPDLQVAIEELITARRARAAAAGTGTDGAAETAGALYDAAASKLGLLGLDPRQIEALAKLDGAPPVVTFTSPITGDVTEKPVVEGAAVMSGQMVLRIVDHTTLWLDAQAFEKDLPFVKVGQEVTASIASRPPAEGAVRGEIIFVHPRLDPMTRTALVRVAIPNPSLALKPGRYATVQSESQLADRAVLVPREAILDTGDSQVAFVALSVGRFEPRRVRMGLGGNRDGLVQVLEGLSPGEAVVTSGQFLIDTESRLREAIQKFLNQKTTVAGEGERPPPPPLASLSPEQQEKVDGVVGAYLEMSGALGAPQESDTPLDPGGLIARAHALHGALSGTGREGLAAGVARAAEAMRGHPIDHQRERFSALGDAVIALADVLPPSGAVGGELYVMNCPMAPGGGKGDWIQASPELANPFFGTDMKQCGELVRTIIPRGSEQP